MNLNNIKEHPYKLSIVMALAVTLLFNICFLLFFAYGDYIISNNMKEEGERQEMRMPPPGPKKHCKVAPQKPMEHGNVAPQKPMEHAMATPAAGEPRDEEMERPRGFSVLVFARNFVRHFISTFILFAIFFCILFKGRYAEWKKLTFIIIACLVWIMAYGYLSAHFIAHDAPGDRIHIIRATTTTSLVLGLIVITSTLIIYYVSRWHEAAIENEALRTLNYSNQYEALKSKLDPHFLFNALNTLSGLIAINSERTEEYIQKLSTIFRTTLSHDDITRLEDEVNFASSYGDLMTIRYNDALIIKYEIPEEMTNRRIVSFGIQILLENVIKHNTISLRMPMEISVRCEGDYVVVSNPIRPKQEKEHGNGMGLKLLSERCIALMDKDIVIENDNDIFTVKVPLG